MAKNPYVSSDDKRLKKNIMVRLDEERYAELKALANEVGVTHTTLARMLILFGLSKDNAQWREEFKEKIKL